MPTGYTDALHKGEPITFEQFVLNCSRAMDAAFHQRDDSADAELSMLTLAPYYEENVTAAKAALAEAEARTLDEWAERQGNAHSEAVNYREEYLRDKAAILARYESMHDHVVAWEPPTEEHVGLKRFMIEQLESSIAFDCGPYTPDVPEVLPVTEYASRQIARAIKDVADAYERLGAEKLRVAGQNSWVRMLRESLGR